MAGYSEAFAACYDRLIGEVDYGERADFYLNQFQRFKDRCELVLDLACGTGSLCRELAARGLEVIGVDGSQEMLMQAREKCQDCQPPVLLLCQEMEALDLYGTVSLAVCMQDSLNHLAGEKALAAVFGRLRYFVEPGGLFIFDMNTPYKHREVLGENTFVLEEDDLYCVWQNGYDPQEGAVDIQLDFFQQQADGRFVRSSECFRDYSYPTQRVEALLTQAQFDLLEVQGDYTGQPPTATEERLVYIARRR